MKTPALLIPAVIAFTAFTPTLHAKDIALAQCPAPVQEAVQNGLNGGTLDEMDLVKVNGLTMYVAEIKFPNSKRDRKLYLNESGAVLKTRDEVALADVPAAVRDAAQKQAGTTGKVDDVDKETADGKVTYRVEIDRPEKDGGDLKLVFEDDGTVVSRTAD